MRSAEEIIRHFQQLKAERGPFENTWQDVADYMRPLRAEFLSTRSPGQRRNQRMFDSTAVTSAENFAGGIFGMLTNPASRWLSLRMQDDELNDYDPVRDWLYVVESKLLESFGEQVSRFYAVLPEFYKDLACFGTGVFYSEEVPGSHRINDSVKSVNEVVLAENAYGDVDTVYRRFQMSGKQALELFKTGLSFKTAQQAERKPFDMISFVHCVAPNDEYTGAPSLNAAKRPFISEYVEEEARHTVARGGYYELPYHVARWSQAAGEVYGRGIGEQVLPDVKMVNRQQETMLKAAQKAADPPLGAPDEGVIKAARTWPGGITYGAIDSEGRQLVKPLYTGGNTNLNMEMVQLTQGTIREGFFFSLMQMVGAPNMTATEWMGRYEEKLRLLGPNLGRIQSEFLSPLVVRRFGILQRSGQLPAPPDEVQGQGMKIEYVSPLAKLQKAGEAQSVARMYQSVAVAAQMNPEVVDMIDHDEAARVTGEALALPPKVMRGKDEVKAIRDQRQQQMQAQQAMAAGEQGAGIVKQLASANKDAAGAEQSGGAADPAAIGKLVQQLRGALRKAG